jgi:hypothetical protein
MFLTTNVAVADAPKEEKKGNYSHGEEEMDY